MRSSAGPVAIVSLLAQRDDLAALLFLAVVIIAIMIIDYMCLRFCRTIVRLIGLTTVRVVGKLFGVIMTALAIELILMGLTGLGLIPKPGARSGDKLPAIAAKGPLFTSTPPSKT